MSNIGVLIEVEGAQVKASSFGVLTAAKENGDDVFAITFERDVKAYQASLSKYGVTKVIELSAEGVDVKHRFSQTLIPSESYPNYAVQMNSMVRLFNQGILIGFCNFLTSFRIGVCALFLIFIVNFLPS